MRPEPHDGPGRHEQRPRPSVGPRRTRATRREHQRQAHQHDEVDVLRRPDAGVRVLREDGPPERVVRRERSESRTPSGPRRPRPSTPAPIRGSGEPTIAKEQGAAEGRDDGVEDEEVVGMHERQAERRQRRPAGTQTGTGCRWARHTSSTLSRSRPCASAIYGIREQAPEGVGLDRVQVDGERHVRQTAGRLPEPRASSRIPNRRATATAPSFAPAASGTTARRNATSAQTSASVAVARHTWKSAGNDSPNADWTRASAHIIGFMKTAGLGSGVIVLLMKSPSREAVTHDQYLRVVRHVVHQARVHLLRAPPSALRRGTAPT